MEWSVPRPIERSRLRLLCGRLWYTLLRYALWYFGGIRFARRRPAPECRCLHFAHRTPLLRKLRAVDMRYQHNKIVNLRIAAARLDGVVLRPGETLSYWRLIGRPTRRKGYLDGIVLFCGTFRPGVGGGLCQLSNLLFWMTLHTPLTVVERYRHSYDVFPDSGRTQPFGSGATCVYPYRDLMIRNDTPTTFRLRVAVGGEFLEGEWLADRPAEYSYRVVERDHCIRSEWWGGYSRHNALYREVYDAAGHCVDVQPVTRNDALMMYAPLLPDTEAEQGAQSPGCAE
ncbi:VanW family protein [Alistipes sp.]|uniref:VanW family protein n=1 Tax=Alistipes sp. TaxID=1872444 RepID=UPI000E8E8A52|nr:VanW family protein [Alistipes sp.]HBX91161.1 vancomycin resistance protein [Alistipes sp.]HCN13642.1 vancomycin resistance protein [Alistipes sp.]